MDSHDEIMKQYEAAMIKSRIKYGYGGGDSIDHGDIWARSIDYGDIWARLSRMYHPRLEEITIHDKPKEDTNIIRIKWGGVYYDVVLEKKKLREYGNINDGIAREVVFFIDREILKKGNIVKKKRNTTSKKQRELKKVWLL